jgi:predicted esterase
MLLARAFVFSLRISLALLVCLAPNYLIHCRCCAAATILQDGITETPVIITVSRDTACNGIFASPNKQAAIGKGVLLIGGGVGNDLNWTVPGSIEHQGTTTQLTISGESHHDAKQISDSLVERGFQVLRWSTIVRGDPLENEWPSRATPLTQQQLIEQASAAVRWLETEKQLKPSQVILIAHSQGVIRACQLIQKGDKFAGLVALSPVYFVTDKKTLELVRRHGLSFCDQVLGLHKVHTLAIFGSRDTSPAVDSTAVMNLAASENFSHLEGQVFPELGHQLGEQSDNRFGPISPRVLTLIAQWCSDLAK